MAAIEEPKSSVESVGPVVAEEPKSSQEVDKNVVAVEASQKREPQEAGKAAVEDTPRKQKRRRLEQAQGLPKVSDFPGQIPGQLPAAVMAIPAKVDPEDF